MEVRVYSNIENQLPQLIKFNKTRLNANFLKVNFYNLIELAG